MRVNIARTKIFLYYFSKGKVIYNQTMTPIDIRTHASRIANEVDPQSFFQITFKIDSTATENLLKIPLDSGAEPPNTPAAD